MIRASSPEAAADLGEDHEDWPGICRELLRICSDLDVKLPSAVSIRCEGLVKEGSDAVRLTEYVAIQ